jgi:hypothetical protein
MARPRKKLDGEKIKQLAGLGLCYAEIAAVLECSHDLLERRYRDVIATGHSKRNASLRRKQYEVAINGNPTMLIWLGKQFLDQKDKVENTNKTDRLDEVVTALAE